MENKDKEKVLTLLSDKAREYGDTADWYDSFHAYSLSELNRYVHKAILDAIDVVRKECKAVDDIDELLDNVRYDYWNLYKKFQSEHFMHLADLAMFAYIAFGDVISLIELNK